MSSSNDQKLRLLKMFLYVGCFGWLISVFAIFLPWDLALIGLENLGAQNISYDLMLNYWLRMAAGAFTIIGVIFGLSGLNPAKFCNIIPVLGWMSIFEGIVLAVHGIRLGLNPLPFVYDAVFCLFVGIGILATRNCLGGREKTHTGN